jgi:hypothetical protein
MSKKSISDIKKGLVDNCGHCDAKCNDKIQLFWECAGETFGFDVCSPSHPMHQAFITFLEMREEEEEEEEEE